MPKIRVVPRTKQQLVAMAVPESANQPEALPWYIYDTQVYVSGATVRLQFFQNVNVNKALSNVEGGGQLPDPQFFEIRRAACGGGIRGTRLASRELACEPARCAGSVR